jgi:serine/threonine protein kinase
MNHQPEKTSSKQSARNYPSPAIPDHQLLRSIGSGNYGEIWLARNLMGTYRAIKVISRKRFADEAPFHREFNGIKKYEPLSRSHPGLVNILHIGQNQADGFFYYIMEIGDDSDQGQNIDPEIYVPKTLGTEMIKRGRLPFDESLQIALLLTGALDHLHTNGLVHRDIKPSNIIFIQGAPKLADIGLVADITDSGTFLGTEGYVSPEGPGKPTADLYSLGKVLYELSLGLKLQEYPAWPADAANDPESHRLKKLHSIILRACALNPAKRFQSARELSEHLARLARDHSSPSANLNQAHPLQPTPAAPLKLALLHQPNAQPDQQVLALLQASLKSSEFELFLNSHAALGVDSAREIEAVIAHADAVIALLSSDSIHSELIAYQLELAASAAHEHGSKPRLLPLAIQLSTPIPNTIARHFQQEPVLAWNGPEDDAPLIQALTSALLKPQSQSSHETIPLEAVGGAVPLDSKFYIVRPVDEQFQCALSRGDSILLLKGARQMGKTSLLARGLDQARHENCRVVFTDFQQLNRPSFDSLEKFYLALGESLADQLDLSFYPQDIWNHNRSPNSNLERYLKREVLEKLSSHFVWGLDEADRLFTVPFSSEVFGLFRSWHNKRALEPDGPWNRLTLVITYATEAHLFITDLNQSPFNVGTRLALEDFTLEQMTQLSALYGSPLQTQAELERLFRLIGGQPYLARRAFNELASRRVTLEQVELHAARNEGIFGDHLRRLLFSLAKDPALLSVMRQLLHGQPCPDPESFYRLRSAGLILGDSHAQVQPRCQLYATYLKQHC